MNLMDRPLRLGLTLSGGGGKGSYQVGVWKALEALGLAGQVCAVSGTSVGALNAVLFKLGDLALAERLWCNLKRNDVLRVSPVRLFELIQPILTLGGGGHDPLPMLLALGNRLGGGVFCRQGLIRLCDACVDWRRVNAGHGCGVTVTTVEWPAMRRRQFALARRSPQSCLSLLLASTAIPGVFPPEEIAGKSHVDGGIPWIGNNTPVDALPRKAIDLRVAVLLKRRNHFDPRAYGGTPLLPIFPSEDLGSTVGGTFDFDGANARRRIRLGYQDAMRVLKPFCHREAGGWRHDRAKAAEIAHRQCAEWLRLQGRRLLFLGGGPEFRSVGNLL